VRRVLYAALAAATVLLTAACASAHHAALLTDTTRPKAPKQLGILDEPVASPDGTRLAVVRHIGNWGYLEVASARPGAPHRVVFSSRQDCCGNILWSSPTLVVFITSYNRVWTVDLRGGHISRIASFSGFHISHDGKWLAGWNDNGPHIAGTVGVISIRGTECHVPFRPKNASDWFAFFSADGKRLSFNRQTLEPYRGWTATLPVSSLTPAPKGDC
jgi:hypothetical protein